MFGACRSQYLAGGSVKQAAEKTLWVEGYGLQPVLERNKNNGL
jgi:hypothetical protein